MACLHLFAQFVDGAAGTQPLSIPARAILFQLPWNSTTPISVHPSPCSLSTSLILPSRVEGNERTMTGPQTTYLPGVTWTDLNGGGAIFGSGRPTGKSLSILLRASCSLPKT